MSGKQSNKENTQINSRKSKLPIPKSGLPVPKSGVPVRKGVKRVSSRSEDVPQPKKLPTKPLRQSVVQPQGPHRQVAAARAVRVKSQPPVVCKPPPPPSARHSQRLAAQKGFETISEEPKRSRTKQKASSNKAANAAEQTTAPFDQHGIEFEADASSLQSILDNTGIQRAAPKTALPPAAPRHTMAATPSQRVGVLGEAGTSQKRDFKSWCDQFLSRHSMYQPSTKKHCNNNRDTHKDEGYSFDASKSVDVDFCGKYNAPQNPTFSSKPESGVVPDRRVSSSLSRFSTPGCDGRLSLAARTPLRVPARPPKVTGPRDSHTGARDSQTGPRDSQIGASASRISICPPVRVIHKDKQLEPGERESVAEVAVNPVRLSLYSKPGLGPQTPLRVLKPTAAPDPGANTIEREPRMSLCPGRVLKSLAESTIASQAQLEPRYSLQAHTPSRVLRNNCKTEAGDKPRVVPTLADRQREETLRLSLALGTPGRVRRKSPHKHTQNTGGDVDGEKEEQSHTPQGKRAEMASASPRFTPGRVVAGKPGPGEAAMRTPLRELRAAPRDRIGTPTRILRPSSPDIHTPLRVLKLQETPKHTPQRVPYDSPRPVPIHSPQGGPVDSPVLPKADLASILSPEQSSLASQHTLRQKTLKFLENPKLEPVDNTDVIIQTVLGVPRSPKLLSMESHLGLSLDPKAEMLSGESFSALMKGAASPDLSDRIKGMKTGSPGAGAGARPGGHMSSGAGHMMDLRSLWKTKKSPSSSRTPVKKEILTSTVCGEEQHEEVTSPRPAALTVTSDKKKKTLTWADKLECFRSGDDRKTDVARGKKSFLESGGTNVDPVSKSLHFTGDNLADYDHNDNNNNNDDDDTCRSGWKKADHISSGSSSSLCHNDDVLRCVGADVCAPVQSATLSAHDAMQEAPPQQPQVTVSSSPSSSPESAPRPPLTPQPAPASMQLPMAVQAPPPAGQHPAWGTQQQPGLTQLTEVDSFNRAAHYLTATGRMTGLDLRACLSDGGSGAGSAGGGETTNLNLGQLGEYWLNMQLRKSPGPAGLTGKPQTVGQGEGSVDETLNISNNNVEAGVTDSRHQAQVASKGRATVDNNSQGTCGDPPRMLDVNSNITATDATMPTLPKPTMAGSQAGAGHSSTASRKRQQEEVDCDENFIPFSLRNTLSAGDTGHATHVAHTHNTDVQAPLVVGTRDTEVMTTGPGHAVEVRGEAVSQTGSLCCPVPHHSASELTLDQSETGTKPLQLPIWTPLALKSVAKRQSKHVPNVTNISSVHGKTVTLDNEEQISPEERPVLSELSNLPQTQSSESVPSKPEVSGVKAATDKKTAFRPVSRQKKFNPSVGALSLRGNLNTSVRARRGCKRGVSSPGETGDQAGAQHERYQEAVCDDEVELYMCRVAKRRIVAYRAACSNPLASILTEGDDTHFVPIQDGLEPAERLPTLESAFEKCMRST